MKRWAVLARTFVAVVSLTGCGSDPRAAEITKAIGFFDQAADNTLAVKKDVAKALETARAENRPLKEEPKANKDDFKVARETAKKLRVIGKKLVKTKSQIDLLQEKATPEEKERLNQRFRDKLGDVITRLEKAQHELDTVLAQADRYQKQHEGSPEVVAHLRKAINDSREEFRVLTKAR
jgi:hypothetical protein